jgi:HSP20 family molecular chaperone IbpA
VTLHKTKAELEEEQSTAIAGRQKRKEMRQKSAQNTSSHRKSHRPSINTLETEETLDIVQDSPNITEDDEEDSSLSDKPTGVNITIKTNRDHPRLNAVTQCTYYRKDRKEREYKKKPEITLAEYK